MDIITGNVGWIEVICGPMFSGKSEELIRRLRRAMIARKRVEVFKPTIDTRYSDDEIVSHGDLRMHSQVVANAGEITERIDWRSEVVGIDEANFMGPQLDRKSTRLNSSHLGISYAVFCLKKNRGTRSASSAPPAERTRSAAPASPRAPTLCASRGRRGRGVPRVLRSCPRYSAFFFK